MLVLKTGSLKFVKSHTTSKHSLSHSFLHHPPHYIHSISLSLVSSLSHITYPIHSLSLSPPPSLYVSPMSPTTYPIHYLSPSLHHHLYMYPHGLPLHIIFTLSLPLSTNISLYIPTVLAYVYRVLEI